jgi:DNA invertase Pin-like site-specific DNA recombinase
MARRADGSVWISYLRVSTEHQGAVGLGIGAQRKTVNDYLASVKGVLLEEFVEVESGKYSDRPQLIQALISCKKKKARLIVAKLDRLARNVALISRLMESKVDFVAADMPTANPLTIHVMAAFAEYERT